MNYNDDYNPFADSSIRQATASPFSNQPAISEYNPFAKTTTTAQPVPPPQHSNIAAVLPPTQPVAYQSPFYASAPAPAPTPSTVQQPTENYGTDTKPASTRIDLSQYERQQTELEQREKRLAERERSLADPTKIQKREKNFPPLPACCPCGPCFFQDISIEIPSEFQIWVRYLYYLWLFYSATLFLNMIAGVSYFGNGFKLMIKLFAAGGSKIVAGFIAMIVTLSFALIAAADGLLLMKVNGFARIGIMSSNKPVGIMMIILGSLWSFISVVSILLTIRVHRLYKQSGASLEQAQREFQSAFVNNPTVRGAAREVATAGINEAIRTDNTQQRPIY
ncbi:unnamed protein product [Rotaria sp. Silwood2]|nr:unnamed protein product [Rotaria sp. Silwood2]